MYLQNRFGDINELRKTVSRLDRYARGQIKSTKKKEQSFKKHHVKKKGVKVVIEKLTQRLTAKAVKIDIYERRINQFRINRMFSSNQKRVFIELNGDVVNENIVPDVDESRRFWSDISDHPVERNDNADWLKEIQTELSRVNKQDDKKITVQDVKSKLGKFQIGRQLGPTEYKAIG